MTRLLTLNGRSQSIGEPKFSLISFSGNPEATQARNPLGVMAVDPTMLSDIDAGIWTLSMVAKRYPGITFGQLLNKKLSGWKDIKKGFSDFGGWIGNKAGDIGDKLGEWGGDTLRLVTDKDVRGGVKDYATGYLTGGTSTGIEQLISKFMGTGNSSQKETLKDQFMGFLQQIGAGTKNDIRQSSFGSDLGFNPMWLVGGLGVGLTLVLLTRGKK